jgi:cell wall-associated NlpC family hydrolase
MRRLLFVVCAVFAAALVVSLTTLSAKAQTAEQYGSAGDAEASQDPPQETTTLQDPQEDTAPDDNPSGASSSSGGSVSQGSVTDSDSPDAIAAQEDLAEEERLPDYSQVVDNTTKGAFRAPGWKIKRGSLSHKGSFVVAEGAKAAAPKAAARFRVKIPSTNDYSVYAWWPRAAGGTARYGVQAASGMKWSKVDQSADSSGMWVKIGTFAMEQGRRSVRVAAKSVNGGRVFADAVAVVRGEAAPPEDQDQMMTASAEPSIGSKSLSRFSGQDVVRQARRHLGDRYRYGTCTTTLKSCTCLTKMAVQPFGHRMGMGEGQQWQYERSREIPKSDLRPGDEVFFKENGPGGPITHVGIYSGNGRIVHASLYWRKVVEKEMRYIDGYFGAKRFDSR